MKILPDYDSPEDWNIIQKWIYMLKSYPSAIYESLQMATFMLSPVLVPILILALVLTLIF